MAIFSGGMALLGLSIPEDYSETIGTFIREAKACIAVFGPVPSPEALKGATVHRFHFIVYPTKIGHIF